MKSLLYILGCAAALLPLTACHNGAPKAGSPTKAAKTYMTYAYNRDFEQFANAFIFASDTMEADRHEANVRAVKEILEEKGESVYVAMDSVSDIRVLAEELDETGTRAKVTLETVCRGGKRDTTTHDLVKVGDDWKFYEDK
ncbi:MAG: DUF4878 domain-containing protein [Bacteroidales bacterium]|nr:DUF4878 domain-containing protein [Bacteroidales bacterium]